MEEVRVRDNGTVIAPEIRGQIVPALCHDKTDRRRRAPWIKQSQRRNTEVRLTHRWREVDSNFRYRQKRKLARKRTVSCLHALNLGIPPS